MVKKENKEHTTSTLNKAVNTKTEGDSKKERPIARSKAKEGTRPAESPVTKECQDINDAKGSITSRTEDSSTHQLQEIRRRQHKIHTRN